MKERIAWRIAVITDPMTYGLRLGLLAGRGLEALARKSWRANELLAAAGFQKPVTDRIRNSIRNG